MSTTESVTVTAMLEALINPEKADELELNELATKIVNALESLPEEDVFLNLGEDLLELICTSDISWRGILVTLSPKEFTSDDGEKAAESYKLRDVKLKISAYDLYDEAPVSERGLLDAQVYKMPHRGVENTWDELVFESDMKTNLLWLIQNKLTTSNETGLKISPRIMNPLLLLHGPPGTGKTTLAYALAQKTAIRLGCVFSSTKLIILRAPSLLSKFFSESAQKIDNLFVFLKEMCNDTPSTMHFVLIDEVEGIAGSRQAGTTKGEAQDSLRATNALLTGLDGVRGLPNVFFLFTTNMLSCLDEAFRDRCGRAWAVNPPTLPSSYTILRNGVLDLLKSGEVMLDADMDTVIPVEEALDSYDEAVLYSQTGDPTYTGFQLLEIVKLLQKVVKDGPSGRFLTQLPEQVALMNRRFGTYRLSRLLRDMRAEVLEAQHQGVSL